MLPTDLIADLRYSVFRSCPSGWQIAQRTIVDHELVLITAGKGEITLNQQACLARPGQLFYFYPGLPHALRSEDADPLQFYALHFSYAQVRLTEGQWQTEPGACPLPLRPMNPIRNLMPITAVFKEIVAVMHREEGRLPLLERGLFLQLMNLIRQDSLNQSFNYAARQKIEWVMAYIRENLAGDLSIGTLADMVHLSSDYLTCLFRRYNGQTPVRFINNCRMAAAREMLDERRLPLREVAAAVGFADQFYFSRLFRQLEGISPAAYRRQAGNWL